MVITPSWQFGLRLVTCLKLIRAQSSNMSLISTLITSKGLKESGNPFKIIAINNPSLRVSFALRRAVNITGTSSEDSIENFKIEDLDKQFSENVRTPLLITKRSSAHLVKTKGCIVNVSSIFGYRPFPQTLTYGMAMKTLIHLTSNSANELASHGVRVNAIIPGAMDTGSQDEKDQSNPSFKKFQDYNSKCHPLGRLGSSHDYSQALLFLVSEHASFITGEILTVDGGRHVVDRMYNISI
ncbi:hypothetical protein BSL78_09302 [Apostichopus japonicus]|uniref:Uncharacterized protein n=1 Tax=Stichopus japonicus TaxID=307972 RepID=A0A2G8L0M8_STIJA|nr:hypothetical protein BSL78_09302 [Apostichopus japonicus]